MLEKDALQKWCPQAIIPQKIMNYGVEVVLSVNRCEEGTAISWCFGSGCMSWRWKKDQWKCNKCGTVYNRNSGECPDNFDPDEICHGKLEIHREGFCGLAGKE